MTPLAKNRRGKMYNRDGSFVYVYFYQNGRIKEASSDGLRVFHEGLYKFKGDVLSYTDTDNDGCGKDYWAKCKFTFVTQDSFRISVIEDTCVAIKTDITSRKG